MLRIIEAIIPSIANYQSNKKVKEKIKAQINLNCPSENIDLNTIALDDLQQLYNDNKDLKNKLEDKAKTNIIGVTIAVTLILGAYSLIQNITAKHHLSFFFWIAFSLFVLSVIYMLAAGIHSIHVLTAENEFYFPNVGLSDNDRKKDLDKIIGLNNAKNTIRNNYIFTAYECIRNSLFCLFAVMVIAIIPAPPKTISTMSQGTFFFSESAMESISTEVDKQVVEDYINKNLQDGQYSVIDKNNQLFLKYTIKDNQIIVHLIEPYYSID